jgi:biofilm protein TabA
MILDNLKNAKMYYNIHPDFKKAFDYLKNCDTEKLTERFYIDGDNVYSFPVKAEGTGHEGAPLENHIKYIDIQYCVNGIQEFGWKPLKDCVNISKSFSEADDFGYFSDEPDLWIKVKPGQFAVFFPEDAHTPKGGKGYLHKILVKVRI